VRKKPLSLLSKLVERSETSFCPSSPPFHQRLRRTFEQDNFDADIAKRPAGYMFAQDVRSYTCAIKKLFFLETLHWGLCSDYLSFARTMACRIFYGRCKPVCIFAIYIRVSLPPEIEIFITHKDQVLNILHRPLGQFCHYMLMLII